jgi:hypothetical protein
VGPKQVWTFWRWKISLALQQNIPRIIQLAAVSKLYDIHRNIKAQRLHDNSNYKLLTKFEDLLTTEKVRDFVDHKPLQL